MLTPYPALFSFYSHVARKAAAAGYCILCGKPEQGEISREISTPDDMEGNVQGIKFVNHRGHGFAVHPYDSLSPRQNAFQTNCSEQHNNEQRNTEQNGFRQNGGTENVCQCVPISECRSCQDDLERYVFGTSRYYAFGFSAK